MAEYQSSLPLIDLPSGAQIVLEAINPATGAQITGVTVANVAITYEADSPAEVVPELPPLLSYAPGVD